MEFYWFPDISALLKETWSDTMGGHVEYVCHLHDKVFQFYHKKYVKSIICILEVTKYVNFKLLISLGEEESILKVRKIDIEMMDAGI